MSTKKALLLLAATVLAFFGPLIVRGEVIYPHDNREEVGLASDAPSNQIENRKFSDTSSFYIPEIHEHLRGDHAAWLATWNPHVELGRPLGQVSGFSPAFLITRILSWTTDDAFVLYTRLAVLTVLLTAMFAFLFLDAIGLHPWASFATSAVLALGVYSMYWLTCVLFAAGWCWSLCLMWLIVRYVERASFARGLGIAFAVYALLMTSYPQEIVWHLYLIAPFALLRLRSHGMEGRRWRTLLGLCAFGALGLASTAPAYLDLALAASRSARLDTDRAFFLTTLTGPNGPGPIDLFVCQLFDVFWSGNPIARNAAFTGISFTPVFFVMLLLAGLDGGWRRSWLYLALTAVGFAMMVWPDFYLFGVDHLGLGLSRFPPMGGAFVPGMIAAAFALDRVSRKGFERPWIALSISAAPLLFAAARCSRMSELDAIYVGIGVGLTIGAGALIVSRKAILAPVLALATVFAYGYPMILARPQSEIHLSSPLVEKVRANLHGRARYASVGDIVSRLLPPNQESILGLSSIHSFNSLSSRAYQDWVLRLSEVGARTYGRQFRKIPTDAKLDGDELGYAGVGLIVGEMELHAKCLTEIEEVGGVRLYATKEAPVMEAQIESFELVGKGGKGGPLGVGGANIHGPMSTQNRLPLVRGESHDDRVRFKTTPAPSQTLLFLSQQHHPQWIARSKDRRLPTVAVNGFYQGVLLPPGTEAVELEFSPFAVWSWVPQVLFVAGGAGAVLVALRRRRYGDARPNL